MSLNIPKDAASASIPIGDDQTRVHCDLKSSPESIAAGLREEHAAVVLSASACAQRVTSMHAVQAQAQARPRRSRRNGCCRGGSARSTTTGRARAWG